MCEFNSDDHYIYYCEQESLRRSGVATIVNKRHAMLAIKEKFGKNAILKGSNLREEGTTRERNNQIGGHRA